MLLGSFFLNRSGHRDAKCVDGKEEWGEKTSPLHNRLSGPGERCSFPIEHCVLEKTAFDELNFIKCCVIELLK